MIIIIPININNNNEINYYVGSSKTYKIDTSRNIVKGFIDDIEAVKQAVYKILSTQRYKFVIYDWNYGVELEDLIGHDKDFVYAEIQRRITEALLYDNRITDVIDFDIKDIDKSSIAVSFKVESIFGNSNFNMEVNI